MPEITVAITTHNLERYIASCLRELLGQTFSNFEILIYDDFSTDATRDILQCFQEEAPEKIHLIFGESALGSPARSRNAVLDSGLVQGKYIVFLDGDDRVEQQFLEKLYFSAEREGANIALCAYDRFEDETGRVLCREMTGFPAELAFPPQDDTLAFINGSLWNKLIRTDCVGTKRIPDFKVGEDLSFQLILYQNCKKIVAVDEILIHYRVHTSSIISNTQKETIYQFAEELARQYSTVKEEWLQHTLAEIALIHIGISMPLRACGNPNIDLRALLTWITDYFKYYYQQFRGMKSLKLNSLLKHGVKGVGIWSAKICYRIHCMQYYLSLYRLVTQTLHIDIKF